MISRQWALSSSGYDCYDDKRCEEAKENGGRTAQRSNLIVALGICRRLHKASWMPCFAAISCVVSAGICFSFVLVLCMCSTSDELHGLVL
jgi:hypothetical protein